MQHLDRNDQPLEVGDFAQFSDLLCNVVDTDGEQIALIPIGDGQAYYVYPTQVEQRNPDDFCLLASRMKEH